MYNKSFYLLFFLLGINASIINGLYFYDLFVFIYLLFYRKFIRAYSPDLVNSIIVLLLLPALFSLLYQVVFLGFIELYSVYIVYNLILFIIYYIFLSSFYDKFDLNYNIIIVLISIPIFLGFLMLGSQSMNNIISSLYHVELTYIGRFGSIWGRDVNQLGYYSTIIIFITLILLKIKKVKLLIGLFIITLALASIALSGMRTGLVLLIGISIFSFFFFKNHLLSIKYYFYLAIIMLCILFFSYSYIENYIVIFVNRFDVNLFIDQLTGESKGHVGSMYVKWFNIFIKEDNMLNILFSFYPKWKFPDSLVIFYFANGGLVGILGVIIFLLFSLIKIFKIKKSFEKQYILIVILFCFVISFKGNFVFNNISMFLFVLIYFEIVKFNKERLYGAFNG